MRLKNGHTKKLILRGALVGVLVIPVLFGFTTQAPKGTSFNSPATSVTDIRLIYDLTYKKGNDLIHDQNILKEELQMIQEAKGFIVADLFLYNDYYNTEKYQFPDSTKQLTEALIAQKQKYKDLKAYVITDEINNSYKATLNEQFKQLEANGIEVIVTDLSKVRDSNPLYAGYYRTYISHFGLGKGGWLKNPFGDNGPKVNIRNYLRLFNFKANHRKVLITEQGAMVCSANPHDGSSYHSNIAFQLRGEAVKYILESEKAVAAFSGSELKEVELKSDNSAIRADTKVQVLTEDEIKKQILKNIEATEAGDEINLGMFYLSHREIIKELIAAAGRGVEVRIVLDPNKDAFGYEKNGIPNRQVATELVKKSDNKIKVRWYLTNGEQYHSKIIAIYNKDEAVLIGGSANFTRRNIDNYNLEEDIMVTVKGKDPLANDFRAYFDRIWENQDGIYTADFSEYEEDSLWKLMVYRIQEKTGLCTF